MIAALSSCDSLHSVALPYPYCNSLLSSAVNKTSVRTIVGCT